jgi:nitrilase
MRMKVAIAQIGSVLFDTSATMGRVERCCREASAAGAQLLVLPEALIGGYPKGLDFGVSVGNRTEAGRDLFLRYFRSAILVPGQETEMLSSWSKELDIHIVVGVIERDGGTLYCAGLLFDPHTGLILKHRKLVPTGAERVIWGRGDGSTMQVADTRIGKIGLAICWENYMPLYRQHLYDQGVQLWCAPTVDMREIWRSSMQHIAYEGRCFVLSACQQLVWSDWEEDLQDAGGVINGGSLIVSPGGAVIAGPLSGAGLLYAEIDLKEVIRGKFDLDVAGHYSRPDIFDLRISGR